MATSTALTSPRRLWPPWPAEGLPIWPDDLARWRLPEEHEMSATRTQTRNQRRLIPSLERLLQEQGKDWLVSCEQLMQLREGDQRIGVRPDAYVLPCRPKDDTFDGWPAYLPGVPAPVFALEVVSVTNWEKDYVEAPTKYALLGVEELVLFDPQAASGTSPSSTPLLFQLYRRSLRGTMVRVYSGDGPVFSRVLRGWLHVDGDEVKVCRDQAGQDVVMTPEEGEAWWKGQVEAHIKAREDAERRTATAERRTAAAEEAERQALEMIQRESELREKLEARSRADREAIEQAEQTILQEMEARARAEEQRKAAEEQRKAAEEQRKAAEEQAREAVLDLCEVLGVEMSEERRAQVTALDLAGLQALRAQLKQRRAWPG